jgi:lipid-binding SYLF domain-containing protein
MFVLGCALSAAQALAASDPVETIRSSEQVLSDLVAIPARAIPHHLLTEAQGVAVIPDVTKVGFVAGIRRGHGVIFVRDAEGEWSLPQFITLTGGSVGWQAGIQATDVVLVFKSRKGVESVMKRKFTIGADASVSAGPVGRDAEAATDAALKAEILSYSRSRGLFAVDRDRRLGTGSGPAGARRFLRIADRRRAAATARICRSASQLSGGTDAGQSAGGGRGRGAGQDCAKKG